MRNPPSISFHPKYAWHRMLQGIKVYLGPRDNFTRSWTRNTSRAITYKGTPFWLRHKLLEDGEASLRICPSYTIPWLPVWAVVGHSLLGWVNLCPDALGCSYVPVAAFYSKSGQLLVDHSHTSSKIFLPWKSISGLTYTVVCTGVAIKCFNESDWANESLYTGTQYCNTVFWLCLNHFLNFQQIKINQNKSLNPQ